MFPDDNHVRVGTTSAACDQRAAVCLLSEQSPSSKAVIARYWRTEARVCPNDQRNLRKFRPPYHQPKCPPDGRNPVNDCPTYRMSLFNHVM